MEIGNITNPTPQKSNFFIDLIKLILEYSVVKFFRYIKSRINYFAEPAPPFTVYRILWDRAATSSADYIESKLKTAMLFSKREFLWDYAFSKITGDGINAEFGVFGGYSINHFAKLLESKKLKIYGFDSFEGLREDWYGSAAPKGSCDVGGRLPKVRSNVTLIKGWFDQTVPKFLAEQPSPFSFVHLDPDTYESTQLVLNLIHDRLVKNTVIVFDEYLGYPNWENGEFLAWQEFVAQHKLQYRYLGFSPQQAAIQIS